MSTADLKANRPLSPHLWIYRWPLTMVMSIVHRITGAGLYFGTLLLVWWLSAAASHDPGYFAFVNGIFGSWIGLIVLFGFTWALLHHMLGGIRHLVWDTGHMLDRTSRNTLALATLAGSGFLTVLLWVVIVAVKA
ncbi:MAG TPA: succinate dehydrogenase, cytochrome b556 subunit [Bauldia sp.]|nr:succinate dehydrogenase, cytochrome b556 subunit [Bauldia sp.]